MIALSKNNSINIIVIVISLNVGKTIIKTNEIREITAQRVLHTSFQFL